MYPLKGKIWSSTELVSTIVPSDTPKLSYVIVTYVDNDFVYYCIDKPRTKVRQIPLVKFMEVAKLVRLSDLPDENLIRYGEAFIPLGSGMERMRVGSSEIIFTNSDGSITVI